MSWELWGSNPRANVALGLKSNSLTTRTNSLTLGQIPLHSDKFPYTRTNSLTFGQIPLHSDKFPNHTFIYIIYFPEYAASSHLLFYVLLAASLFGFFDGYLLFGCFIRFAMCSFGFFAASSASLASLSASLCASLASSLLHLLYASLSASLCASLASSLLPWLLRCYDLQII